MKEIISRAIDQGGRLRVRSALNPALWLCAIVSVPMLIPITMLAEPPIILQIAGIIPILITSVGFLFLLFFDRDKLQSEDFQIRKKSLEMIEQSDGLRITNPTDLHMITNPESEGGDQ